MVMQFNLIMDDRSLLELKRNLRSLNTNNNYILYYNYYFKYLYLLLDFCLTKF